MTTATIATARRERYYYCSTCFERYTESGRAEHGDRYGHIPERYRTKPRSKVTVEMRRTVYEADDYACQSCSFSDPTWQPRNHQERSAGNFLTVDHIWPLSMGGSNGLENLQTLCFDCNQIKAEEERHWGAFLRDAQVSAA